MRWLGDNAGMIIGGGAVILAVLIGVLVVMRKRGG
jgi:hypothetical protein